MGWGATAAHVRVRDAFRAVPLAVVPRPTAPHPMLLPSDTRLRRLTTLQTDNKHNNRLLHFTRCNDLKIFTVVTLTKLEMTKLMFDR